MQKHGPDLSKTQKITEIEKESFRRYCLDIGADPQQYADTVLALVKNELQLMIAQMSQVEPEKTREAIKVVRRELEMEDWWEYKAYQRRGEVRTVASHIVAAQKSLGIDYAYLSQLCRELNWPDAGSGKSAALRDFLLSIPQLGLYGKTFNAFIERGSLMGNIPCVCRYEQLINGCEKFVDLVMSRVIMMTPKGTATFRDESERSTLGSDSDFDTALKTCVELALCQTDRLIADSRHFLSRGDPDLQLPARLIMFGSNRFVTYHEYGHLLRGHLQKGVAHALEFEADDFARKVGEVAVAAYEGAKHWYMVGAAMSIILIEIIEKIQQLGPSHSHPSARNRLRIFLGGMNKEEGLQIFCYLDSAVATCNPCLRRHWGIEIKLGN